MTTHTHTHSEACQCVVTDGLCGGLGYPPQFLEDIMLPRSFAPLSSPLKWENDVWLFVWLPLLVVDNVFSLPNPHFDSLEISLQLTDIESNIVD